jgi:hypothetical protein
MALMAVLGLCFVVCGVVAGAVAFAPAADAETPRSPTVQVSGEAQFIRQATKETVGR